MFKFSAPPKTVDKNLLENYQTNKNLMPLLKEKQYLTKKQNYHQKKILEKTLKNFREKKICPFSIKISNKYRIKTNLNFFLIDQNIKYKKISNSYSQTSKFLKIEKIGKKKDLKKFKEKNFYQMKKTGRDQICQVNTEEIFDIEKSLVPIINNLKSKIIEQSLLEVKQEMEICNLQKIKKKFYLKKKKNFEKIKIDFGRKEKLIFEEKKNILKKKKNEFEKKKLEQKNFFFDDLAKNMILGIFGKIGGFEEKKFYDEKLEKKINIFGDYKNWLLKNTEKEIKKNFILDSNFENLKKKNQKNFDIKNKKKVKICIPEKKERKKKIINFQNFDFENKKNFFNFFSLFEKNIYNDTIFEERNLFLNSSKEIFFSKKKKKIINISNFKKLKIKFSHNIKEKISKNYKIIEPYFFFLRKNEEKIFNLKNSKKNKIFEIEKKKFSFCKKKNWEIEANIKIEEIFQFDDFLIFLKIGDFEKFEKIPENILDVKFQIFLDDQKINEINFIKKDLKKFFDENKEKSENLENEENLEKKNLDEKKNLMIKTNLIHFSKNEIFLDQNNFFYFYKNFKKIKNFFKKNISENSFLVDYDYLKKNWLEEEFEKNSKNRKIEDDKFFEIPKNIIESKNYEKIKNFLIKKFLEEKKNLEKIENEKKSFEILESLKNEKKNKNKNIVKSGNLENSENDENDENDEIPFLSVLYKNKIFFEDEKKNFVEKIIMKKLNKENCYKIKIGVYFKKLEVNDKIEENDKIDDN